MKLAAALLTILLLSGCSVPWGAESSSALQSPSSTASTDSSVSASMENIPHYATAEHLDELGYVFSVPLDIGVKDENKPFVHSYKVSELEDIYPYSDLYRIAYFDENQGELNKWMVGKYTALHPLCYYGQNLIDGESNQYAFALLQSFSNEDLEPLNTVLRFKDKEGYTYTRTVEQVKPYIVYQDNQITVYNFFDFVRFPSLEAQMEERWEIMNYNQYGLSFEWILKVRDYFIDKSGGIGRFITELPKEASFFEIVSVLQTSFSKDLQATYFNKSNPEIDTSHIDIPKLLQLLHEQKYVYLGTWRSFGAPKEPTFFTLTEGYGKICLYKDGTIEFANEKDGNSVYYKSTPCSNLYQWLETRCL